MKFLRDNKRFSFKLDGIDAWERSYEVKYTEDSNTLLSEYLFDDGLKITNVAKKYDDFGAYEWVNYIENTSSSPTGIISELWDCDAEFPIEHEDPFKWEAFFPDAATATKIYAPSGSTWTTDEFYAEPDLLIVRRKFHLYPGKEKKYSTSGGRSSEKNAPFFNVHKNGKGYIFAVGWTGQWNTNISRTEDTVILRSKIEDTNFRVLPGEKFRTSSVVILPYEGDVISSQNKWRRLVKTYFSLVGKDERDAHGPLCAGIWGGMSTSSVLARIKKIKEHTLPFEYVWMDAGWYGGENTSPSPDEFEGDWGSYTGDWRVSTQTHPNGLRDVSQAVHDAGMKFLLWFEPERVRYRASVVNEHPEYFLSDGSETQKEYLLDLGNREAWNYCYKTLAGLIEELNIDCYRQDFNFIPLPIWRYNDAPDRVGISEIKHINGMYELWDKLLERFPSLIIDNCASGGRRIDIETLRRSIPLWRSDYQCPANYDVEASQCHNLSYNIWMPYSGTGSGRLLDEYRIRSAYGASMITNYSYSEHDAFCDTQEKVDFIKKYTTEYLRVRPYFSEDFYPLTEFSDKKDVWCATQFDRPSMNDGIVQVFKREKSPYDVATFFLRGIDEDKDYLITDIDGGEFAVSGRILTRDGFKVNIPDKRVAKIYFYKTL